MDTKKKMAAAMAAVTAYMRSQEEAAAAVPAIEPSPLWGMSGRMAQMQLRNMMQMKAFK